MSRFLLVAALVLVSLAIVVATVWAQPNPLTSCWRWENPACGGAKALVCPGGDGSSIFVSIMDISGPPLAGATVTATITSPCDMVCAPITGVTNTVGQVWLNVAAGVNTPTPPCCVVMTEIVCMSTTIPWCPICAPPGGACVPIDSRDWISPDMNADCQVNPLDFSIFAVDWLGAACRTDYNCDIAINALDFTLFALHWLH